MAKFEFTDRAVRELAPPSGPNRIDYALNSVRGFAIQTTNIGSKRFLLVYVARETGRERRLVLGEFGPSPKLSVSAARRIAGEKRALVDLGRDPWLERKQARAEAEARPRSTFGSLMSAYVESLRRARKASAEEVNREVAATIERPHGALWKKPAVDVTLDDLVKPLHRLTQQKKWRQAEKTRSYIRAAYAAAAASRGRATASDLFAPFATVPNVARDLVTIDRPRIEDGDEGTGKRALSVNELSAYWRRIEGRHDAPGALLRAHLLTGAQRCAQLARLTHRSIHDGAIVLKDGKGRRKKARTHVVPLLEEAVVAFAQMKGDAGEFAFSVDGGATGAGFHVVRRKVADIAAEMVAAGEVDSLFTPGELRITVETRLAAAGVSMEVRAQLQSHGLGGVQNKHYDKHDYLTEKRHALETLLRIVKAESNVVSFPARAA